jgi:hypothetical protein
MEAFHKIGTFDPPSPGRDRPAPGGPAVDSALESAACPIRGWS